MKSARDEIQSLLDIIERNHDPKDRGGSRWRYGYADGLRQAIKIIDLHEKRRKEGKEE